MKAARRATDGPSIPLCPCGNPLTWKEADRCAECVQESAEQQVTLWNEWGGR